MSRAYDEDVDELAQVRVLEVDGFGEVGVPDVVEHGDLDGDRQADHEPAHDHTG